MSKPKQIAWESWNARVEEMLTPIDMLLPEVNEEEVQYTEMEVPDLPPELFLQPQKVIYTPMGAYPEE